MKVLLGWEIGGGQGHIQRLVALAQHLQICGYTPIFALKHYNLRGLDFPWQKLDVPPLPFSGREMSHTFADILATFGFDDVRLLTAHLQAWQDILVAVQPKLVITDHAPGLVLAAQGRVPTLVVGSHFAVPPPVAVFPPLRLPTPAESDQRQIQVIETIQQVIKVTAPLGKLLNGDRRFIFSLPELDCYRFWRKDPDYAQYAGIHIAPLPDRHISPDGTAWAYLATDYPARDLVYNTLRPQHEFKPLHEALSDKSLAIHHGGLTTTIGCLLMGIPQLILPRYLEQQLTAFALLRLGVIQTISNPTWENLLITQAQTYSLQENAKLLAIELQQWNQNFIEKIMNSCFELID
ncbi:MAG: hypothetical protein KME16_20105 [Scytolyngbya sp. HA4215-MV1]|jgi:hypothetical protein|nr:hypothetical protein [Scytolyngbya sp. HA4215-MV1]